MSSTVKRFAKLSISRVVIILLICCSCLSVTGCSDVYNDISSQNYDNTVKSIMDDTVADGGNALDVSRNMVLKFFASFKNFAPVIIMISFFCGGVVLLAVKKQKAIRKKAIFVLMIGVPVFVIIIVYVSAFLLQYMYSK